MQSIFRRLSILVLTLLTLIQSSLAAFTWSKEPVEFSDVPSSHWAHYYISSIYQSGLMVGTGDDTFSPSGAVSVAQALTVAVRVWDLYRDGDGIIEQIGENWYDGAVQEAIRLGLITPGQFDSYTRSATRAEVAALLTQVLPAEKYQAINKIEKLPDVNQSTPHAEAIFTLYNAGIISGSDGYGTFHPQKDITRAELCTILYRLIYPHNRKEFTLLPPPVDLTVYSSSKRLLVDGFPVYGLTRINGEYYLPVALLEKEATAAAHLLRCYSDDRQNFTVSFRTTTSSYDKIPMLDYAAAPPEGKAMGKADSNPGSVEVNYGDTVYGAVYTINGQYPMINLRVLGAVEQGNDLVLNVCENPQHTTVYEKDLVGTSYWQIPQGTDRETAIAIHDYLVNYLTYDILTSAPRGTTEAEFEAAAALQERAYEEYTLSMNRAMSTKYAICEDYAQLFQALCIRFGIPCDLVFGSAGGAHAWNKVYIDGQWLYMDCTWDDPVSKKPVLRYDYCLVGPDRMVQSHHWEGSDYPMPEQYDPAWEQLDPNNITSADMFRKCLVAQLVIANRENTPGEKTIKLRVTKSGAYGGTGCLYAGYDGMWWWSFRGGYDSSSGMYVYHFE